jgi:antitoxin ParD1/3/4
MASERARKANSRSACKDAQQLGRHAGFIVCRLHGSAKNGKLCQHFKLRNSMSTMNISLTPQLEKLVQDRVKSGRYTSASEVIREALRLLETHDRALDQGLTRLQSDVQEGLRALDAGKSAPFDDQAVMRIKRAGRAKLQAVKAEGS